MLVLPGCDWFLDRALNRPDTTITLPPPPPERLTPPVFAVVDGNRLIAEMADGSQCVGLSGQVIPGAGWSGTLAECPYPYRYQVSLAAGAPTGAIPLNPVTGPILPAEEGDIPFRPIAEVRITDSSGVVFRFESQDGF
ncbi:MAG: hypothetical protein OXC60_14145 [Litoreibacter sp.]|nr:hypothetical protein [Litoreibacter sp.]